MGETLLRDVSLCNVLLCEFLQGNVSPGDLESLVDVQLGDLDSETMPWAKFTLTLVH